MTELRKCIECGEDHERQEFDPAQKCEKCFEKEVNEYLKQQED